MSPRTVRLIAFFGPGIFEFLFILVGSLIRYFGPKSYPRDEGLLMILLFIFAISSSAFILNWAPLDRFWKTHPFAVASAIWPFAVYFLGMYFVKGPVGYYWLGLTVVIFLSLLVFVLSIPFTYFIWWHFRYRKMLLQRDRIEFRESLRRQGPKSACHENQLP